MVKKTVITFGLLNPYLVQSTTLFLTDLLATYAIILSLLQVIIADFTKRRPYYLSFIYIVAAVMIRPSSLVMVPVIGLIYVLKKVLLKDISFCDVFWQD